ncbi:protein of unknown function [Pararobbsia alpina]|uniref:hypothetical protein n=1 Tax=Pararobbsia alpina TaxID=621374 RepID=UPI0039A64FC3
MSFFGNLLDMAGDVGGELTSHPWQTAATVFGVPGFDPFFGGLFNNRPGGALISPTGNFTSSAWQDMYRNNPGDTGALNTFSTINGIADKVAPVIASFFATPAIGAAMEGAGIGADTAAAGADTAATAAAGTDAASAAGSTAAGTGAGAAGAGANIAAGLGAGSDAAAAGAAGAGSAGLLGTGMGTGAAGAADIGGGLTGLFSMPGSAIGASGAGAVVPSTGLLGGGVGIGDASASAASDMLPGPAGLFNGIPGSAGVTQAGAWGNTGASQLTSQLQNAFKTINQGQQLLKMGQPQQQQLPASAVGPQRFGNQRAANGPIGPSMPYAQFNQTPFGSPAGATPNYFGFGGTYG